MSASSSVGTGANAVAKGQPCILKGSEGGALGGGVHWARKRRAAEAQTVPKLVFSRDPKGESLHCMRTARYF